jgi:hypothetical protein
MELYFHFPICHHGVVVEHRNFTANYECPTKATPGVQRDKISKKTVENSRGTGMKRKGDKGDHYASPARPAGSRKSERREGPSGLETSAAEFRVSD